MIPGSFWTRPLSTKSTRTASSATPPHDSLIRLANPRPRPRNHCRTLIWGEVYYGNISGFQVVVRFQDNLLHALLQLSFLCTLRQIQNARRACMLEMHALQNSVFMELGIDRHY